MVEPGEVLIETTRLRVRIPTDTDADLYLALWNDPRVMRMVSFPEGLSIARERVVRILEESKPDEYERRLLVEQKADGVAIGECKLGRPDTDGVSETDVKLLPPYWGRGYGTETKQALVDHIFTHTDARFVKGTPNKRNIASIRMQEAVGGRCVGEGCFEAPKDSAIARCDVPYLEYRVDRATWKRV